jgi:EAL domain-containing protein (putative c-di-GMP-specific phosphodiesterase class I)
VLIVDDDRAVVRAFGRIIGSSGVLVTAAWDPSSALHAIEEQRFDAVICDIGLPGMSGITLARHVRNRWPEVPIILVTGDPRLDTALEAFEIGAVEYMSKPVDPRRLASTVKRAVNLHRLAQMRQEAFESLEEEGPRSLEFAAVNEALDRALAGLWVAFQPIVDWNQKTVVGYEALLRSHDPVLRTPPQVLDAAEQVGRLHDVGSRVRELAAAAYQKADHDALLFLNLHPHDMLDATLYDPGSALVKMAHRVVLEITERSSVHDVMDLQGRAEGLRRLGFRIAVDDLGAGYAGLSSFAVLEPELAKLDMSLVRSIHTSQVRQRVVTSMVSLCRDLGNRVVAEGVETAEERDALAALGCDLMQGYLFAKPGPPFPAVTF